MSSTDYSDAPQVRPEDGLEVYHSDEPAYQTSEAYRPGMNSDTYKENYRASGVQPDREHAKPSELPGFLDQGLPETKRKRKWLWPLLAVLTIIIVAGAVLGGVLGSRH